MDKNTLWGLILMGAIFFGFMYCNQPSRPENNQAAATAAVATEETQAVVTDSLDNAAKAALANAIKTLGTAEADGSYTLANEQVELHVDSADVTGHVTVGTNKVNITDLTTVSGSLLDAADRAAAMSIINDLTNKVSKYHDLARSLGGEETTTVFENDLIKLGISSRGAIIKSAQLKKYNTELTEEPSPINLFQGPDDGYSFTLTTADQRFETSEFNFTPVVESDSSVIMTIEPAPGAVWALRYTLPKDSYVVRMEIVQQGIGAILPASTASIDMRWHQTMARNEKGRTFEERNSAIYYKYVGEGPDDLNSAKDVNEELNGRIKWVAFKNQFFSSVLIPSTYFNSASLQSILIKNDRYLKDMTMNASLGYNIADGVAASFDFYLGPNDYPLLSSLDDTIGGDEDLNLTRLIPLGWGLFRYINIWIVIPVFTFLSSFMSSYGLIILLLTIFIKLIIFPFTFKSYKSQARMRVLQPEVKAINEKYPGQENAMKRQQETMNLYSRTGASPFSGCLPMLFQMPVLIAMFSFFPSAIELRGASFLWAHDLSAPDFIVTLPFSIPFYGNGVSLFCLLMTIVNIVYMKINMQNQPGGDAMPGMKWMSYLMPVMFLFIFNDYASGLSYYYFLSLLITIVQTWAFRHFIDEKKVRAELMANAKKPRKKSGFMARLEEAQRQQQAMQRQQVAARNGRNSKGRH